MLTNKERARYFLGRIMSGCGAMLRKLETTNEISKAAITDIKIAHGQIQVAFGDVYLDAKHDEKNNVDTFDDDGDVVA